MDAETKEFLEMLFARREANLRRDTDAIRAEMREMRGVAGADPASR